VLTGDSRQRDRIAAYANYWAYSPESGADVARFIARPLELGFKAVKWDPFGSAYMQLSAADRRRALDQIAGARAAAGPDIDLLIEGHGRFDLPTARLIGTAIAEFDPLFFEEPMPPDTLDAYAELRQLIDVPVAAGERYTEKFRFLEAIRRGALDWLQPDACHVGGLFEMKKIAAIGEAAHLPFAPHNPMGPVGNAMTLQLAAAVSNFALLETMMVDVPWRSEVVSEDVALVGGAMTIPDRPGLGIEFHEEAALRHPFSMKEPQHFRKRVYPTDLVPWYRT
jgi:galactonate dehydratase